MYAVKNGGGFKCRRRSKPLLQFPACQSVCLSMLHLHHPPLFRMKVIKNGNTEQQKFETVNSFSPTSISDTPSTSIPAMFFQSEPSATLDKSNKKSQPSAIDEIDCRVSPHLWRHQPQTGHTRRCVPPDRKCLLVNRKVRFRWKDSFGNW